MASLDAGLTPAELLPGGLGLELAGAPSVCVASGAPRLERPC